jgi:hypothetical protein
MKVPIYYVTELNPKGFRSIWKPGLYKYFTLGTERTGGASGAPVVVGRIGILKSDLAEHGGTLTITASSSMFKLNP